MLPHLDAAYNLARWLVRDPAAAEDVVQEAMLRALSYFSSFRGINPRAWLLQIVRNAAYSARARDIGGGFPADRAARLVRRERGGIGRVELPVQLGLHQQDLVALGRGGHAFSPSSTARARNRRARNRRDITVPIGVRVISAISL